MDGEPRGSDRPWPAAKQQLEGSRYGRALAHARLDGAGRGDGYRALATLWRSLDALLAAARHPALEPWRARVPHAAMLEARAALHGASTYRVDPVSVSAALLAQRVRFDLRRHPTALLGILQILEWLEAALEGRAAEDAAARAADGLEAPKDRAAAEEAAAVAASSLARALDRGEQIIGAEQACLHLLNLEAGSHPIPSDIREIEAALIAGEASWARHPYYARRFGDRGLRFTRSDSVWLVAVANGSREVAFRQLGWLSGVLANRGMPTHLMDDHLDLLAVELDRALGHSTPAARTLSAFAARLRAEREQALPPGETERWRARLDDAVRPTDRAWLPGAGALVVAALADERCGHPRAAESLLSWLADPQHNGGGWVRAVQRAASALRTPAARLH